MMEYKKNCPECGVEQVYKDKYVLARATHNNTRCKSCSNSKENNPFYGKTQTEEARRKISENHIGMKGKTHTADARKKMSDANVGREISDETRKKLSERHAGMKGKVHSEESKLKMSNIKLGSHHTDETKRKMRISVSDRMKQHSMAPNFNPSACILIEEYGKKHGYNFQHAMNGGEYHIKELGYWVDGYDRDNNVVIEVDEKYHRQVKYKERDLQRQQEIVNLLNCSFIRLTI